MFDFSLYTKNFSAIFSEGEFKLLYKFQCTKEKFTQNDDLEEVLSVTKELCPEASSTLKKAPRANRSANNLRCYRALNHLQKINNNSNKKIR